MPEREELLLNPKELSIPLEIHPMIPVETFDLPHDLKRFIVEPKLNGIRGIARISSGGGRIDITAKSGRNIADSFPEIVKGLAQLGQKHSLVLDGEIIFSRGQTDKERITVVGRSNSIPKQGFPIENPCAFVVFDLMYLDGEDLRREPLRSRKSELSRILHLTTTQTRLGVARIKFAESKLFDHTAWALAHGFEGVVFKRKDSSYVSRRSAAWLKLKFPGYARPKPNDLTSLDDQSSPGILQEADLQEHLNPVRSDLGSQSQ